MDSSLKKKTRRLLSGKITPITGVEKNFSQRKNSPKRKLEKESLPKAWEAQSKFFEKSIPSRKENLTQSDAANSYSHLMRKSLSSLDERERENGLLKIKRNLEILENTTKALSLQMEVEKYLELHQHLQKIREFRRKFDEVNEFNNEFDCIYAKNYLSIFLLYYKNHKKNLNFDKINKFEFIGQCTDYAFIFNYNSEKKNSYWSEVKKVISYKNEIEKNKNIIKKSDKRKTLQSFFSSVQDIDKYVGKATAFQKEIDRASKLKKEIDNHSPLADEIKRQVFTRMREQNYRASLKLEGLTPDSDGGGNSLESIRAKYAG